MGEMYPPTAADYAHAAAQDARSVARRNAQEAASLRATVADLEVRLRVLETMFGVNR